LTGRQRELHEKYKDYGFEIVAVDLYRTETESTKQYAAQKGLKYPILLATDDVLTRYGGIRSTPVMFLLDRSGKISEIFDQFNKEDLYIMENQIRSLLELEALPPPEPAPPMNLEILKANKAPDFSLPSMNGETITLSKLNNKMVVLVFWTMTDVVSIGILPYFQATLYEKYHDQNLEVIGIHIEMEEEAKAKAASFLKGNQINLPVVQATPELIKKYGNVNITPVIILVDQYGFIKEIYEKFNYELVAQMEDNILSLLKPPPSPLAEEILKDPEFIKIKELADIKCARCHYLERVLLRNKTEGEWKSTVYRMREKQTDWISQKEANDIIKYLSRVYSR
jgi:peroxiredoxin